MLASNRKQANSKPLSEDDSDKLHLSDLITDDGWLLGGMVIDRSSNSA